MRIRRYSLWLALLMLCWSPIGFAQEYGGYAGAFLRMGVGPRAIGMGCAFVAVADDASATYWNPGGLVHNQGRQLLLSYHSLALDRKHHFLSYTQLKGDAAWGLSWINAGTDDIVVRDTSGRNGGKLSDKRNAYSFSFAKRIGSRVSFGLTAKLLRYELAGQDAKGSALDVGILVRPTASLSLGLTIKDLGGRLSWQNTYWERETTQENEIPSAMVVGVSCRLFDKRLLVAADVNRTKHLGLKGSLGGEFRIVPRLYFRGGATDLSTNDAIEPSFTGGVSIGLSEHLGLDYAYMTDPIGAGDSHVWSLTFPF